MPGNTKIIPHQKSHEAFRRLHVGSLRLLRTSFPVERS